MEPKKVGRTLGIGVRVAARMVRERVADASANQPPASATARPQAPAQKNTTARGAAIGTRVTTAKRGAKAFGMALWGPFSHAGSVLWLEITGLFFALFALFFAQNAYRVHTAWRAGAEHVHLVLYALLTAGFLWFSFSSFARAYRKSKRRPDARP